MKLDIIIVNFAVVASVIIPYLVLILMGQKETKKFKNKFLIEAKAHNLSSDETESWNSNILGIDRVQQKLLLLRRQNNMYFTEIIDLKNIRTSRVISSSRSLKINDKPEDVLQRVDLEFEIACSGEKKLLNLYDSDATYLQDYEVKRAEKWNQIINSCLSSKPVMDTAA